MADCEHCGYDGDALERGGDDLAEKLGDALKTIRELKEVLEDIEDRAMKAQKL
jgi:hypothetical protein